MDNLITLDHKALLRVPLIFYKIEGYLNLRLQSKKRFESEVRIYQLKKGSL